MATSEQDLSVERVLTVGGRTITDPGVPGQLSVDGVSIPPPPSSSDPTGFGTQAVRGTIFNGVARWLPQHFLGGATSTVAWPVDVLFASPHYYCGDGVLAGLGFHVTVGGTAGSVTRVGLYRAISKTNIYPGPLVADSGEIATTVLGVKTVTGLAIALETGYMYWVALISGVAGPTLVTSNGQASIPAQLGYAVGSFQNQPANQLNLVRAYGALPANFPVPGGAISSATLIVCILLA